MTCSVAVDVDADRADVLAGGDLREASAPPEDALVLRRDGRRRPPEHAGHLEQRGPGFDPLPEVGSELAGNGGPADADADPDESSSGPDSARSGAAADGGSDLEHRESPEADEPATTDTERRSTELRVDRLSARVEEFATYAEALEPFLDEHGTAPEFVDRVESRVDDIDERITDTRNDLEMKLDEEAAAIRAELSTETTDLRSELEETRSEVAALRDDLGTVQEDVTALREEIAALSEDVGELTEMRESMATALSNGPLADPQPTVKSGESND